MILFLSLCGKDYYRLLRVAHDADAETIKKAFRKQQLRFHPDRLQSEDEKVQAQNKIFDLNQAMDVLSNAEKRKIYDEAQFTTGLGEEAIREYENRRQPEIYKKMPQFNPESPLFNPNVPVDIVEKAGRTSLEVELSFLETLNGIVESVSYDVLQRDEHCNGTGALGGHFHECTACAGRGQWFESIEIMPGVVGQLQKSCTICNGTGRIIERKCDHCGGSGVVSLQRQLLLNLPSGVYENYSYIEQDAGSIDALNLGLAAGDLEVIVRAPSEVEHAGHLFRRVGQDIVVRVRVPLVQMLFGGDFGLEMPNSRVVRVATPAAAQIGDRVTLPGLGFSAFQGRPAGDLVVELDCTLPAPRAGVQREQVIALFE